MKRVLRLGLAAMCMVGGAGTVSAQMRTVDPNQAGDLAPVPSSEANYGTKVTSPPAAPAPASAPTAPQTTQAAADTVSQDGTVTSSPSSARGQAAAAAARDTYAEGDVLSAAEGVFGKGAEGLAKMIESIFKKQGRPNAYIAGREAGGAIILGVRYGSGTMFHKVEGQMPIYWTGPSIGFDLGGNGAKSFTLVYNLYDSADIYRRFPEVQGTAYIIGGFTATYLRRGNVVLIPIHLGVGWRLGVNVGYMNFTRKSKWIPL